MAKAIEQAQREKNVVIYRFSGFTANSGNEYTLLKQLCEEITGRYNTTVNNVAGIEEGERPPVMEGSGERRSLDPNKLDDLIEVFRRCLVLSTEDKRLVLFIDALDQIDGALTSLSLPQYTKLVVSTTLDKEIELPPSPRAAERKRRRRDTLQMAGQGKEKTAERTERSDNEWTEKVMEPDIPKAAVRHGKELAFIHGNTETGEKDGRDTERVLYATGSRESIHPRE